MFFLLLLRLIGGSLVLSLVNLFFLLTKRGNCAKISRYHKQLHCHIWTLPSIELRPTAVSHNLIHFKKRGKFLRAFLRLSALNNNYFFTLAFKSVFYSAVNSKRARFFFCKSPPSALVPGHCIGNNREPGLSWSRNGQAKLPHNLMNRRRLSSFVDRIKYFVLMFSRCFRFLPHI